MTRTLLPLLLALLLTMLLVIEETRPPEPAPGGGDAGRSRAVLEEWWLRSQLVR